MWLNFVICILHFLPLLSLLCRSSPAWLSSLCPAGKCFLLMSRLKWKRTIRSICLRPAKCLLNTQFFLCPVRKFGFGKQVPCGEVWSRAGVGAPRRLGTGGARSAPCLLPPLLALGFFQQAAGTAQSLCAWKMKIGVLLASWSLGKKGFLLVSNDGWCGFRCKSKLPHHKRISAETWLQEILDVLSKHPCGDGPERSSGRSVSPVMPKKKKKSSLNSFIAVFQVQGPHSAKYSFCILLRAFLLSQKICAVSGKASKKEWTFIVPGAQSLRSLEIARILLSLLKCFSSQINYISLQITILTLKCCKVLPLRLGLNLTFS